MTPHQERLLAHSLRMPPRRAREYDLPTGRIIEEEDARGLEGPVVTVGDVSSLTARRLGLSPVLSVFDGLSRRRVLSSFASEVEGEPFATVRCPPNILSRRMSEAVRRGLSEGPALLRADGEDDLAVLAVVLFAPDGTNVLYGCPGRGLVHAVVDDRARSDVEALVDLMPDARRGRFIYSVHAVYIRSVRADAPEGMHMNVVKAVLWLFVALCAAVLVICAASDPDSVSDSLEHMVFHMAYVGMLVVLADMTIRYKD